jgi:putative sterol carrier protein
MRGCILILFGVLLPVCPMQAGAHGARETVAGAAATSAEPDPTSPDEVFEQMRHSFRADKARGQHLKFQFNFGDPQGGRWWLEINDGAYTMGKGAVPRPDVTLTCTGADWVRLANGTLSGWKAFLTGRLRVKGSQFQAHKLDEIFP